MPKPDGLNVRVVLDARRVGGGQTTRGRVVLSEKSKEDRKFSLSSDIEAVFGFKPEHVTVPAGKLESGIFEIITSPTSRLARGLIWAEHLTKAAVPAKFTVQKISLVGSVKITGPTSVPIGGTTTGVVDLPVPASGDIEIQLSHSPGGSIGHPNKVTVFDTQQTSDSFEIVARSVGPASIEGTDPAGAPLMGDDMTVVPMID